MSSYDICVVGAGPAGIAVAERLLEGGKSVCLIESGLRDADALGQELSALETDQRAIKSDSRARAFGGTTKYWSGRWKFLDPIDFTHRAGMPLSGWPIDAKEIESYLTEAARRFGGISPQNFKNIHASEETMALCGKKLVPTTLWTMPRGLFDMGALHYERVSRELGDALMLGATIVSIEKEASAVRRVRAIDRMGNVRVVEAGIFVLACGGIENARLLLAWGLGGEAVGRYFMDHPKGVLGAIVPRAGYRPPPEWLRAKAAGGVYRTGVRLLEDLQRSQGLLNAYLQFEPIYSNTVFARGLRALGYWPTPQKISLMSYFEMAPRGENRVTLTSRKDRYGVPLARVSYELGREDKETITRLHTELRERVEQEGIGRLESPLGDWSRIRDASHHMGTTRMGEDPATSVVDADCKMHGLDNLYVAGSSVFPTSGNANPTATILALALRLGGHLAKI